MACTCSCCDSERLQLSAEDRQKLLSRIIDMEADMFAKVNEGKADKVECQTQLKTFRSMRNMSFAVLSDETLQSYYEDLKFAVLDGRNLVTEKYARMDKLIPPLNDNSLIEEIVQIEKEWMQDLHAKYPHAVGMSPQFENYERSELETYSDETITSYYRDVATARQMGLNLVEARYNVLYRGMGFTSLEEVEAKAAAQGTK